MATGTSFYAEPILDWDSYRYNVSAENHVTWAHDDVPEHPGFNADTIFNHGDVQEGRYAFLPIKHFHTDDVDCGAPNCDPHAEFLECDNVNPGWVGLLKVSFRNREGNIKRYIGLRHESRPFGAHGRDAVSVRDRMLDALRGNSTFAAEVKGATEQMYGFDFCIPKGKHILGVRLCWNYYVVRQRWDENAPDDAAQLIQDELEEEEERRRILEEEEEQANLVPPEVEEIEREESKGGGEELHRRGSKLHYGIF